MQEAAGEHLRAAGFEQYEVSAWARPGQRCRHNLNYWRFGDYLGIGAGAHGKLTDDAGRVRRMSKQRHPKRYLEGQFLAEERSPLPPDLVFEFFLNALRLRDGFTPDDFRARTGLPWDSARNGVEAALARGLLEPCAGGFRASELGWRFGNDLQALFLP
jgi:oxygen-independent coproporphyrinogen-3 oxidase